MKISDYDLNIINDRLINLFGIDSVSGKCMWRVVFSDDQYETRHGTYNDFTREGIYLRTVTEVREVPKYQWIQQKYILEHLVAVPEINLGELPTAKMSYEVIWVFADKHDNFLPPRIDACELIINTVYAAMHGTGNLKKYVDPEGTTEGALETKRKRIDGYIEELFGEQSGLQGTTYATGESIIVPRNFEKSDKGVN